MLLSKETIVKLNTNQVNVLGHMCFAAAKLWNECNYERKNYKELQLEEYPNWYYQKKKHKDSMWYKALPSQTAQEVCKLLDKSWKSFYKLLETSGVTNPKPPRYKNNKMFITYMQYGIVHDRKSPLIKLTISRQLKEYMSDRYDVHEDYLYVENKIFSSMNTIKQIKIYPPNEKGSCRVIVVYEIADAQELKDNGRYLAIDLGIHNLMTCYDNVGKTMILGRKYQSICNRYDKEIARIQSQWYLKQYEGGIETRKTSKHIIRLHRKKRNSIRDYLHKISHFIVEYCKENDIHEVIIGDISGIRKKYNRGAIMNQKMHALPYTQVYQLLEYKLKMKGIRLIKQNESWTSQCSPFSEAVSSKYSNKDMRIQRGQMLDANIIWNADAVGAYNILRKYKKEDNNIPVVGLSNPYVIKVAV